MRNVYLAGQITGLPKHEVKAKFDRKKQELTAQGIRVYHAAAQLWSTGLENEDRNTIVKAAIIMMMECEELHLFPCWAQSKEATLLRDIAMRTGMTIIYY